MNMTASPSKKGLVAVILSMSLLSNAGMVISPALGTLGRFYSDVPPHVVSMLVTVPALAMIPAGLLSATLQKMLGRRRLFLLSIAAIFLAGLLPSFLHSFPFLFLCRVFVGFAIGLYTPVNTSLIISEFEGAERSRILGWSTAAESIGGAAMVLAGGWLATLSWDRCFYLYFLALLPLLIVAFFFREGLPRQAETARKTQPLHPAVWHLTALICVTMTFLNVAAPCASSLVTYKRLGGSFLAGILTAAYLLSGFVCGLMFGKLDRLIKQYGTAFGIGLCAAGMLLLALGPSVPVLLIGAILGGFGMGYIFPAILSRAGSVTNPEGQTLAAALVLSGSRVGMFLTTLIYLPLMTRAGFPVDRFYLTSAIVLFLLTILCAFRSRREL